MTSLLKKTLSKKLAPLFENMSPDDVSLSLLKGKGGLRDINLNRALIQDMLPPWLVVETVKCDHLGLKIPWARLKKKPVKVMISKVNLVVVYDPTITTLPNFKPKEEPKPKSKNNKDEQDPKFGVGGKYGLIDAIIDGIKVTVDCVSVEFKGPDFNAQLELNGFVLASPTPTWKTPASLKETRVMDKAAGLIHLFKQATIDNIQIKIAMTTDDKKLEPFTFRLDLPALRLALDKPITDTATISSIHVQFLLNTLHLTLTRGQLRCLEAVLASLASTMPALLEQWFEHIHSQRLGADEDAESDDDDDNDASGDNDDDGGGGGGGGGGGIEAEGPLQEEEEEHEAGEAEAKGADDAHGGDDAPAHSDGEQGGAGGVEGEESTGRRKLRIRRWRRDKTKKKTGDKLTKQEKKKQKKLKKTKKKKQKALRKGSSSSSVGGFVLYKSFNDLLPEKVNSVHVHVEKVLLRLSKLDGTPQQQRALLKANPHHHLLMTLTLNNIIMHHYYKHAFGARIPHRDALAPFWQAHATWGEHIAPPDVYEHLDHVRVSTTSVSVRRLLMVVDATRVRSSSSSSSTATKDGRGDGAAGGENHDDNDDEHGDSNEGPRPRVILLQPTEEGSEEPMVMLALASFSEPPATAKAFIGEADPNMTLPPAQQFVHLNNTKITADVAAGFEVGRFLAESLDSRVQAPVPPRNSDGGGKRSRSTRGSSSDAAASQNPAEPPSPHASTLPASLMVQCRGVEVQLPPVLASVKEPDRSIFVTATVDEAMVTNTPTATQRSHDLLRTSHFYNGWLYRRSHAFPEAEGEPRFLPAVTQIAGLVQDPVVADDGTIDTEAAATGLYVTVNGLAATANESRNGKRTELTPVLNRTSVVLRMREDDATSYMLLEVPDQLYIHFTHDVYVYITNMINIITALPFHILEEAFSKFKQEDTPEEQSAGGDTHTAAPGGARKAGQDAKAGEVEKEDADDKPTSVFAMVPAITVAVNNGKDDLIHACAYGTQVALTTHEDHKLVRGAIQELILTQNISSPSGAIVRDNTPRPAAAVNETTLNVEHVVEPQVLCRVTIPTVPCADERRQYETFQRRYHQARRAQHHLARSWAEGVRRGTSVDPAHMRQALEMMDKEADDSSQQRDARRKTVVEAEAEDEDDEDYDAASLSSSEDDRSLVSSDDFALEQRVETHSWQQVEFWTGEGASQHEPHILDDVDAFLASSYARVFACASQEVVPLPSPRGLGSGEVLEFIPEHDVPPVSVRARVRWLKATLDKVPLESIADVFNNADADPLDAFPPSTCGPEVAARLQDLDVTVLDGAYLERLPLFAKAARPMLVQEASTRIRVPHVGVHLTPDGTIDIDLSPASHSGAEAGKEQLSAAPSGGDTEAAKLRAELDATKDELAQAREQLERCMLAMSFSANVVEGVQAQAAATLEEFQQLAADEQEARRGRLADTSIRARLQELLNAAPDTTI